MITLKVPDMSCGHCTGVISKAIKELDQAAAIGFDLLNHVVRIETAQPRDAVIATLTAAGYPATPA